MTTSADTSASPYRSQRRSIPRKAPTPFTTSARCAVEAVSTAITAGGAVNAGRER